MPWFKLDCGWWLTTSWIMPLSEGAQLTWTRLIEYTKEKGTRGTVKALPPLVASTIWFVRLESVTELLEAAIKSGAVVEHDGFWTLTTYDQFSSDPTAAERQAKSRANKSQKSQSVTVTNGDICESRGKERKGNDIKLEDNNPLPPSQGESGETEKPESKPRRTWAQVRDQLTEALPQHKRNFEVWFKYRATKKGGVWCDDTVQMNLEDWKDWTPERLQEAIRYSIKGSYTKLCEPNPPRQNGTYKPQPQNGKTVLTPSEAARLSDPANLPDLGSPVKKNA